ncbi:hypothetical protein C8R43DRAFT_1136568 [Mycena crocata]|nr:hypothetical protein C8R43DRAFT_1136568 [Mycena crocata]
MQGTSYPAACWTLTAIGVRLAQELGVQMRKPYDPTTWTVEEELYKRVFWMLPVSDAMISTFLGRPRATTDDEYDLDYPVNCDDSYWEYPDPQQRF